MDAPGQVHHLFTPGVWTVQLQSHLPPCRPQGTFRRSHSFLPRSCKPPFVLPQTDWRTHLPLREHSSRHRIHSQLTHAIQRQPPHHFVAGKWVLHYLARTLNLHLHYGAETENPKLHAYADTSWVNKAGHRSVSGYTWFYAGGLISHVSKKQTTVALSSTKAEYMAVTHVIQEGLWLKSLFTKLSFPSQVLIKVFLDNTSTIALSTAAKFHQHTKHIDIQYRFIHKHVDNGTFRLIWLSTYKNIADILMKPLPRPIFSKLSAALGLVAS